MKYIRHQGHLYRKAEPMNDDYRRYVKKEPKPITAVQLNFESLTFNYEKWGDDQTAKPGDWVVDNAGETYTIDKESFAKTYSEVSAGQYIKTAPVWAIQSEEDGQLETKEGVSHYNAGDVLVFNNEDLTDGYSVPAEKFFSEYEEQESTE